MMEIHNLRGGVEVRDFGAVFEQNFVKCNESI